METGGSAAARFFALTMTKTFVIIAGMKQAALLLVWFAAGRCSAQAPQKLEFDAATVKATDPNGPNVTGTFTGGPGTADPELLRSAMPLRSLFMIAYQMHSDQIIGPAWLAGSGFELRAKIPAGATWAQVRIMLQNLLIDRFAVELHREKRDFTAYDMTVVKGGSKLKQTEYPDAAPQAPDNVRFSLDKNDFPVIPKEVNAQLRMNWIRKDAIHSTFRAFSTSRLAEEVAGALPDLLPREPREGMDGVETRVFDKTGLNGKFDFTLSYQDDSADATGPTIFKALENQLGLHLEKIKTPLDVIVIDHIEKTPGDN